MEKSMEKDVNSFLTKCPHGHKFGVDAEKYQDCDECMFWDNCSLAQEALEKSVPNNYSEGAKFSEIQEPIKFAETHLKNFIEFLRKEGDKPPLMEEAKKYLTQTCQEKCKYVGTQSVEGAINGFYSLVRSFVVTSITEKAIQPSPLIRTCEIKLSNIKQELKLQCILVKESSSRKPSEDGTWGIDGHSFKQI